MGQRGKGAKPTLKVVDNGQSAFGFAKGELSAHRSTLPWEIDGLTRLDRVVAFLEDLPITQGSLSGTKLQVRDWQRDFLAEVYGEDAKGTRPIRTAILSMARKNGKTQLVAGLALCHLMGSEAEGRGEVYAAANDREQAGKCFAEMVAILNEHPELLARVNIVKFSKRIEVLHGDGKGSIFAALSADATTKHGLSPSFIVYDELGQAPILADAAVVAITGGAFDSDSTADLIAALEMDDVTGTRAFLTNPTVMSTARKTKDGDGHPIPLSELFHGERIEASTQVPDDIGTGSDKNALIYGEWASLYLGYWSGIDLLMNPYHSDVASKGGALLHAFLDCDVVVRHPEGFRYAEID